MKCKHENAKCIAVGFRIFHCYDCESFVYIADKKTHSGAAVATSTNKAEPHICSVTPAASGNFLC